MEILALSTAMPIDLVDCRHCNMTGTCRNGLGGRSCNACIASWRQSFKKHFPEGSEEQVGLMCSRCHGKGITEPMQSKVERRFPVLLALIFVGLAFLSLLLFGLRSGLDGDKVLIFVGTLVGSITGYYFGGERPGSHVLRLNQRNRAKDRADKEGL